MLDLHNTYDATGSTDTVVTENNANAVIPVGDGATTIGLSPWQLAATLIAYGATVDAAGQALTTIGLQSNNLADATNQLVDGLNTTPVATRIAASYFIQLGYGAGPNYVRYANEAAGKTAPFKIDWIPGKGATSAGSLAPGPQRAGDTTTGFTQYSIVSGACTAGVYNTTSFAPTNTPPVGKYAILGARVSALTTALTLRFQHTDFGGCFPGFPVTDYNVGALTPGNIGGNTLLSDAWQGFQFVYMSQLLGVPCCPIFTIQGQGTGLNLQFLDTAADTPQTTLNLWKIA